MTWVFSFHDFNKNNTKVTGSPVNSKRNKETKELFMSDSHHDVSLSCDWKVQRVQHINSYTQSQVIN